MFLKAILIFHKICHLEIRYISFGVTNCDDFDKL